MSKETWEDRFDEVYPLQSWTKDNPEQAIFINPVLQKSHKKAVKQFIKTELDNQKKELLEKINKLPLCYDDGIQDNESDEDFIRGEAHIKQHIKNILK